jgi:endogenous inhibitor of DNA gyrase (YacG/DUF329 family)
MKCPTCDKEATWQDNPYRPFCSERCKLVDLGKWVNDEYRVPGREVPTADRGNNPSDSQTEEEI